MIDLFPGQIWKWPRAGYYYLAIKIYDSRSQPGYLFVNVGDFSRRFTSAMSTQKAIRAITERGFILKGSLLGVNVYQEHHDLLSVGELGEHTPIYYTAGGYCFYITIDNCSPVHLALAYLSNPGFIAGPIFLG